MYYTKKVFSKMVYKIFKHEDELLRLKICYNKDMKQNKVLIGSSFGSSFTNYKYSLIKFFELGILKNGLGIENNNVKGYYYSINTVYRCKKYLDQYFNKMFGSV